MYKAPEESTAMACGLLNAVATQQKPATVVTTPFAATFRIRLLRKSAMYRLPELSTASPCGRFNSAEVAGPPSPEDPDVPFPAKRVKTPLGVSLKTRLSTEAK